MAKHGPKVRARKVKKPAVSRWHEKGGHLAYDGQWLTVREVRVAVIALNAARVVLPKARGDKR